MFSLPQWSNRRKAALAATLAFLLWAPTGLSEVNQPVVTGHSTFFDGEGYDRCLASIAGVLQTDVKWFNDMVLARRYGGKGTFVYIQEAGASQDPTRNSPQGNNVRLWSEGVAYDFVDPNGAAWRVEELFYARVTILGQSWGEAYVPPRIEDRTYVWVVELSAQPIYDQFAGDPNSPYYHDVYNFVSLIDTCKMNRNAQTNYNKLAGADYYNESSDTYDYNITHDDPAILNSGYGHPDGETAHTHESFVANIFVGVRPYYAVAGVSDDTSEGAAWRTEWAQSGNAGYASRTPSATANQTGVP